MSKIEWTEKTWNPLAGCAEVSPGCTNCYAAKMAFRLAHMGQAAYAGLSKKLPNGRIVWTGDVRLLPERLQEPLLRKRPTTYFVNSMSDLFHKDVPFEFIEEVFLVMAQAKWHTFQVLTKRAARMAEFFEWSRGRWFQGPPSNIWLGVSVENQKAANERIPYLLQVPAAIRFLSCEPLVGPLDLTEYMNAACLGCGGCGAGNAGQNNICIYCLGSGNRWEAPIHWVICGGESGPGARPMHPDWARSLRDQCTAAGVAFFFKQWGAWTEGATFSTAIDKWAMVAEDGKRYKGDDIIPAGQNAKLMSCVGKSKSGRLLDRREHNEMPLNK